MLGQIYILHISIMNDITYQLYTSEEEGDNNCAPFLLYEAVANLEHLQHNLTKLQNLNNLTSD